MKSRNYDPASRTVRKRVRDGDMEQDTVEKEVEGLAQKIIAEDETRRAQELVIMPAILKAGALDLIVVLRMSSTSRRSVPTGT
jgi:coiled-coil domain-containing protein 12